MTLTDITIDTSALISVIGNESSKTKVIEVSRGYSLCAPKSVHWEIGNALSAMLKRDRISVENAKLALTSYNKIPIRFIDVPLSQAVDISANKKMYAYDAYLIQCAHMTGTPLLTLDLGLSKIAREMGIQILEITH